MITALVNGRVLTADGFVEGKSVVVEGGRIAAVVDGVPAADDLRDLGGGVLLPGFIDTQVNGGGGVLFNDDPSVEAVAAIGRAHRRFGTTGFLPILISDDQAVIARAIAAADEAIAAGVPGVLGVHIEGPFISERRKGIHDPSKFQTLDESWLPLLTSLKRGRTLVTLAPETMRLDLIGRLRQAGVIVAAGHTNAGYETMRAALEAGVTGFTHLFNAMSPLGSREPGVVGAALEDPRGVCGIIVDGRHVHPAALRLALRLKGEAGLMLVTDAMPTVGLADKTFELQGRRIVVRDGVCVDEAGTLAGSDLDMAAAVRNSMAMLGVDLASAARMASLSPARFLGLDGQLGVIAPGYRADLVLVDDRLDVLETWIGGNPA